MTTDATNDLNAGNEEKTAHKYGYELTYYPGFARRAVVREKDGSEFVLFEQTETYHLPKGHTKPRTKHKLRLKGGKKHQDVTLEIHDPELRIAKITVELYGEDHEAGGAEKGKKTEVAETFSVDNDPVRCPPNCDPS